MSTGSLPLARRVCLSVPASQDRMVAKALGLTLDMVMFDLEDSVADEHKSSARSALSDVLPSNRPVASICGVRINSWNSPSAIPDIEALAGLPANAVDVIVLPKVEQVSDVLEVERLLIELGMGHVRLDLQIESPRSLVSVEAIAGCSSRVAALVFGPADFAASMGMPQLTGSGFDESTGVDYLLYPKSRIAVAAKANGVCAIDGPYLDLSDIAGLARSAATAAALGFDGKWAIHPQQVELIVEAFTPGVALVERAKALLEAYEQGLGDGRGSIRFDGEMIDEASRQMALQVLARSRRLA
jgi:citrate lyase subunit beta/citryl-CoA lyase